MTEREERLNPYNRNSMRAVINAASSLCQQIGQNKGVVHIDYGDNHGILQIDVFVLTEDYMPELKKMIPKEIDGFGVICHAPYWSIGELCTQFREQVNSYPICFFGSPTARERDKFYHFVMNEEKKKWNQMSSEEHRIFIDNLIARQRESGWDAGNCYDNWRKEDF